MYQLKSNQLLSFIKCRIFHNFLQKLNCRTLHLNVFSHTRSLNQTFWIHFVSFSKQQYTNTSKINIYKKLSNIFLKHGIVYKGLWKFFCIFLPVFQKTSFLLLFKYKFKFKLETALKDTWSYFNVFFYEITKIIHSFFIFIIDFLFIIEILLLYM